MQGMSVFGSHLVSAYLWQNPRDNMLKRISKNQLIVVNVLLFLLPFVYQFLAKTDKLSGEYGHYNVIVYVAAFLFGIIFFMVDYPKTEEDKDLRDGNRFLISNTLIILIFSFAFLIFDMDLTLKLGAFCFLLIGNTIFWSVTIVHLNGENFILKYSNEVIEKNQRIFGFLNFIFGLVLFFFSFYAMNLDLKFISPSMMLANLIISVIVRQYAIRSTPESERYDDPERFNNASRVSRV